MTEPREGGEQTRGSAPEPGARPPAEPIAATRADASAGHRGRSLTALQQLARQFEILGEVGRGGMGVVYRARDRQAGREVAIKLLLALPSEVRLRRFAREGETAARLRHKGIVAVHSAGEVMNQPYLVCELVKDARQFDEALEGLELPAQLALFREVVDAVAYAHSEGVIHRDLKPANVIVDADLCPRVTDFGLARHEGDDRLTRTGASLGTPTHMAPEQGRGDRDQVGPPADVWSLGIMLHEIVCGSPPFSEEATTPLEAYLMLQNRVPPTLRARGARVSPALNALARRALAQAPGERFPHAGALRDALDEALAEGVEPPASLVRRGVVGGLGLVAGLGLAGLALTSSGAPASSPAPDLRASPVASPAEAAAPPASRGPKVAASELLMQLAAEPDPYVRLSRAWDWLEETPRAEGHERVRALIRSQKSPVRTHELSGATLLAYLADGRLAMSTRDGRRTLWRPGSDETQEIVDVSEGGCSALVSSPDRRSYALLDNLKVGAWVFPGRAHVRLSLKTRGIALLPSGDLVVGDFSGLVRVFDPQSAQPHTTFRAHGTGLSALVALASGGLVTASRSKSTRDSLKTWTPDCKLDWSPRVALRASSLSVDAEDRNLVVEHSQGLAACFDLQARTGPFYFDGGGRRHPTLRVPRAHEGGVTSLRIGARGLFAYSTGWGRTGITAGQVRVWSVAERKLLQSREQLGLVSQSDLSPDGRWLAVVNGVSKTERRVEIWSCFPPP